MARALRWRIGRAASQAAWLWTAGCAAAALAPVSGAAEAPAWRFELSPYAGYRFGGAFEDGTSEASLDLAAGNARGLIVNVNTPDGDGQWEVLYARQRTSIETSAAFDGDSSLDVDAEYLQAGGTYLFDGRSRRPFIALTLGAARFRPAPARVRDERYFSASLAGGVQLRATKRLGVRVEGRAFASFIDSEETIFCAGGALLDGPAYTCAISAESSTLIQWQASVGFVFRFGR